MDRYRKANRLLTFLIMMIPWAGSYAQWAHTNSDLAPDKRVLWGTLSNGLRYAFLPHQEPPGKLSLRLYVKAGSLMETEQQRGLAHFLEHMAFNGSQHFPPGELIAYLQRIGMAFGADTNAYTNFRETVYQIELPSNETSFLKDGLKVLRDYADGLLLLEKEIERERGVILSEKRARDSVSYREFIARWRFLFPQSRLSQRFPIGKENVIRSASRSAFLDFYQTWYTPHRMVVIVVGDTTAEMLLPLIETSFNDLSSAKQKQADPDLGSVAHPGLTAFLNSDLEARATRVAIQTVQPYTPQPDTRQRRIRELYQTLANQILSRRLSLLTKQQDAAFYEGEAYAYDYLDYFQVSAIELVCQSDQWEPTLKQAEQNLRQALQFGFTASELAEVSADLLLDFEQRLQSAPTRRSRELAAELVHSIATETVFSHPETDLALAQTVLETVTQEECLSVFRSLWDTSDRYLFVSGNLELADPEKTLLATYTSSQTLAVAPSEEGAPVVFAYTDWGPSGDLIEETVVEDLAIHQLRFANKVRVNLKHTDFEADTIHIAARFGGGMLAAKPERAGLELLAQNAFIEGGLVAHSFEELKRILAGKNVHATLSVEDDAYVLRGKTDPDDLLLQLQLLCAYLTAPGYREEALWVARKHLEARYRRLTHTAEGIINNQVARFLASGDFRFGVTPQDKAMARTLEQLRAALTPALQNSYLEVSVVGAIPIPNAKTALAATFGALPQRSAQRQVFSRDVTFPKEPKASVFYYESERPRAIAAVYWPTTDMWNIQRTRRLNLLARVLRDRLRLHVREADGKAYSPYAVSQPSDTYSDYGLFYAFSLVEPTQVPSIIQRIQAIVQALHTQGVTQDELARALNPTLSFIKDHVRNNAYWLDTVLISSQEYPQRLEWARTFQNDYATISVDDLNRLAREYLTPEKAIAISVLPQKPSETVKN